MCSAPTRMRDAPTTASNNTHQPAAITQRRYSRSKCESRSVSRSKTLDSGCPARFLRGGTRYRAAAPKINVANTENATPSAEKRPNSRIAGKGDSARARKPIMVVAPVTTIASETSSSILRINFERVSPSAPQSHRS